MKELIKQYIKHLIDKLFFLSISFKTHIFISVFTVTSLLTYYEKIDGGNYAMVLSVLLPTVVAGREISKHKYNVSEE